MRLTSKGQVTIPQQIRDQAGLVPGCNVEFHFDNGRIWLSRKEETSDARRERIRAGIRAVTGSANAHLELSTDDIMAMTRES